VQKWSAMFLVQKCIFAKKQKTKQLPCFAKKHLVLGVVEMHL